MAKVTDLDVSRIPYYDLAGRYIFRKRSRYGKLDNSRLYKMDLNRRAYVLSGKGEWISYSDFYGEWSGLVGDTYEYIILTKEQAIEKAKERNIIITE